MKRIFFLLFASILVLSACGNDGSKNDDKRLTDEQKLEKSIKNEVGEKNFSKIIYNENDKIVAITLKDFSGFNKDSVVREMQDGAGKAVLGVKKTKLNIDNVVISVEKKTEDNKLNKHNNIILKMSFDKDLIKNLNKDNIYKIRENARSYANNYWLDPNFK
ncbi:hypothetical protein [Staphylococcus lutrae]|uniref:Lipoprotein n=1 Tax=Staphylococcus lutrae TaxID=155085 RepID=A0AAC9RPR2_9STAP|nr:hypothetical protein [Staphylococcus lutrae]ARJ51758.1 hypothetical protein B5P37_10745 [Staphylococcus lutrae]PNZ34227.1 hypothetical protein CD134_11500 [Staphylococcus lutrae]